MAILKPLSTKSDRFKNYYEKLYKILIFGELATILFEGLFDILISAYITFSNVNSYEIDLPMIVSCMLIVFCFVLIPAYLVWLIR